MKLWFDPPLTRLEKAILCVALPVAVPSALQAGLTFGRWVLAQ